jgi:predicted polyphosphate/ATP-dependent NAD kinase
MPLSTPALVDQMAGHCQTLFTQTGFAEHGFSADLGQGYSEVADAIRADDRFVVQSEETTDGHGYIRFRLKDPVGPAGSIR